jgi:porphobilinogen synthase
LWRATPGRATFAHQVSGEYSMIMAAAMNGWIGGDKAMMEA